MPLNTELAFRRLRGASWQTRRIIQRVVRWVNTEPTRPDGPPAAQSTTSPLNDGCSAGRSRRPRLLICCSNTRLTGVLRADINNNNNIGEILFTERSLSFDVVLRDERETTSERLNDESPQQTVTPTDRQTERRTLAQNRPYHSCISRIADRVFWLMIKLWLMSCCHHTDTNNRRIDNQVL